jgi:chemotaxis protein MotB
LENRNRRLAAEKKVTEQELYEARNFIQTLKNRTDSRDGELMTANDLLASLRQERDVLDEYNQSLKAELERLAGNQRLGDITIEGPKLPAELDNALERFAQAHPSDVVYDSRNGIVRWKADLLFALGSDVVKESSKDALRAFSSVIKSPAAANFEAVIVGHTDNKPIKTEATRQKHPTNWHLSAHRAIAVAEVLLKDGYAPQRVGVLGCGEYRPVADNASASGSSRNRRVEVYLVPVGSIVAADGTTGIDSDALAGG